MSPTGSQFATFSFPDRKIRIFDFPTGKLYRTYDESITTITEMQQAGTGLQKLEDVEFGRRLAIERDIESPSIRNKVNVVFDESGHFILYGSVLGTKVLNTFTNRVVKVYGRDENFRALNLCLYQGQPQKKGVVTISMAASSNPLLQDAEARDPVLFCTAASKVRFYLFTNDENASKSTRDIQNEKPRQLSSNQAPAPAPAATGSAAILHTTYGDVHLRLFPEAAPKAVENFVTHAKNGYYNNTIFHRVIRKFMIQVLLPRSLIVFLTSLTVYSAGIPSATARAGPAYGAPSLPTSSPRSSTTSRIRSAWRTRGQTRTGRNSSSPRKRR